MNCWRCTAFPTAWRRRSRERMLLTGPLSHLIEMATQGPSAQMKAGEDAATAGRFHRAREGTGRWNWMTRRRASSKSPRRAGRTGKIHRGGGQGGTRRRPSKPSTPDAEKAMPAPAELLGKLFRDEQAVCGQGSVAGAERSFLSPRSEKGENDAAGLPCWCFICRPKGKGGRMRYARQEALMAKDGAAWRIQQITLVLDPDDEKKP